MNQMEKIARINELTKLLNAASLAYYQRDTDIMTDKEYDACLDELAALEAETGFIPPDSPTARIGHEVVSALEKVPHRVPMMSLDKTKDEGRLLEFLGEQTGLLSWKMDGLAIELTYSQGVLERAVTRGNGLIGEKITHNAKRFVNIPFTISHHGPLYIRGEAVISYADFDRINGSLEEGEKYKNPRNLCSGTVRSLDNAVLAARNVSFIAYALAEDTPVELSKKSEVLDFLAGLGFQVVDHELVDKQDLIDCINRKRNAVDQCPFATDGLVLTYDDIAYGRSLGTTAKFPKDSLAFKWADEEAETTLLNVEWNTSRTGLINPVAVFESVDIEGSAIERASLHNVSVFEALELAKGDRITVYKANMIIPQIAENLTRNGLVPPTRCPVCGDPTEVEVSNGNKFLYCGNPNCSARAVMTIVHYISRDAMNVEGLSEQTVSKFHDMGILRNYVDIYSLHTHEDVIINTPGFGRLSFDKLTAAIERSKSCHLYNFIYGLGIKNVGLAYAKELCGHYNNKLSDIMRAGEGALAKIPGIGPVIANSLKSYFSKDENKRLINEAAAFLTFKTTEKTGGKLSGRVIVITGDLTGFSGRKELEALIESQGGKVASAVSGKTDFLINNDAGSPSSKNKAAKELGVPVVTEREFLDMFGM